MRFNAWPFSLLDRHRDRASRPGAFLVGLTKRVFRFDRAPLGLMALLFALDVGVYLIDVWSTALIAVRQLLFVVVVAAGATRNFWATTFFALLSAFLHVQAFREYVPHPEDFTDLHYIANFLIALVPYALAGYLGAVFVAYLSGPDGGSGTSTKTRRDGR
jgi:hypothetical protein